MLCDPELKKILAVGTVIWFQTGGFFILRNLSIGIAMRVDWTHLFRSMLISPHWSDKKEIVLMALAQEDEEEVTTATKFGKRMGCNWVSRSKKAGSSVSSREISAQTQLSSLKNPQKAEEPLEGRVRGAKTRISWDSIKLLDLLTFPVEPASCLFTLQTLGHQAQ